MFVGQKFKEIILSSIKGCCTCKDDVECLDISTLKKGDEVRITDNKDNNVDTLGFVKVRDVATYTGDEYEG